MLMPGQKTVAMVVRAAVVETTSQRHNHHKEITGINGRVCVNLEVKADKKDHKELKDLRPFGERVSRSTAAGPVPSIFGSGMRIRTCNQFTNASRH